MRKGLSPMITVVILIVITIAVAAILAYWAQQYIVVKTKNATESDRRISDCLKIDFSVRGKVSGSNAIIVVESTSRKEIYGMAPFVLENNNGDVLVIGDDSIESPPLNTTIDKGDVVIFTIDSGTTDLLRGENWQITAKPAECPGIKRFGELKG